MKLMKYCMMSFIVLLPLAVQSDELSVPYVFKSGEKALASEVNENFSAVIKTVNGKQDRINGQCEEAGIRLINADGSVACATVASPTIDTDEFQKTITGTCDEGSSIRVIRTDGSVECEIDDVGDGQAGDANGLVKAWAKINAKGEVIGCFKCKGSSYQGVGLYVVDFSPLDIRSRPRLAVADGFGELAAMGTVVTLNDVKDQPNAVLISLWSPIINAAGPLDHGVSIFIY